MYTPLVVYGKRKDFIKSVPQKLNEGETEFVSKLRDYLRTNHAEFKDKGGIPAEESYPKRC